MRWLSSHAASGYLVVRPNASVTRPASMSCSQANDARAAIGSAAVRGPTNERTSQYCAPIEEAADANAHRFYCRDGRSFEQHG